MILTLFGRFVIYLLKIILFKINFNVYRKYIQINLFYYYYFILNETF